MLRGVKSSRTPSPALAASAVEHAGVARVVVVGRLDRRAASCLEELCDRGGAGQLNRLEVDLTSVTDVTPEGVEVLTSCLAKRRNFVGGVGVRVSNEAGRRALLESMAEA
jgi:hypothetical protein